MGHESELRVGAQAASPAVSSDTASSDGAASARAIFWLRALVVALVIVPATAFAVTTWNSYRGAVADARREVEQAAIILQHGYQRVLGANVLATRYVQDVLAGLTDADIRRQEAALHQRLAQITKDMPEVTSVWVIAADGTPVVSSMLYPVPPGVSAADRPYFIAMRDQRRAVHVGEVIVGRAVPTRGYTFSVPRQPEQPGVFNGIIQNSLDPEGFTNLAATLERTSGMVASLWREDGSVLGAYPGPIANGLRMAPAGLPEALKGDGVFDADGQRRLMATRKLGDFPIYVSASIPLDAVTAAAIRQSASHLIFGVPATITLVTLTLVALRRTRRLAVESERRRHAEAALRQSQRLEALGRLTGGVAHDFNNLLTVIRGHIELIHDQLGAHGATPVHTVLDAVERGSKLTRQLLTFSRSQVVHPEVIDLGQLLARLRVMIGYSLRGDISVAIDCAPDVARVKVDPSELELALLNLSVNARDAMPEGGTLTIGAHTVRLASESETGLTGDFVAVTVRDTGHGIDPKVLDHVFDPFFTTKPIGQGTGLGLSQVYGFATQAGGTARITSALRIGTLVTMYLPVTTEPLAQPEPATAPVATAQTARILLVDDNDAVAEVTAALLDRLGFATVRERSAATALQLFETDPIGFDLVITDIVMPGGLGGVDLARELRLRKLDQRVMLVTGYSAAAEEAVAAGFTVLRKPYRKADLNAAVAEALGRAGDGASEPVRDAS